MLLYAQLLGQPKADLQPKYDSQKTISQRPLSEAQVHELERFHAEQTRKDLQKIQTHYSLERRSFW